MPSSQNKFQEWTNNVKVPNGSKMSLTMTILTLFFGVPVFQASFDCRKSSAKVISQKNLEFAHFQNGIFNKLQLLF